VNSGARSEYQLTDKGRALMPVLVTLAQGGEVRTEPEHVGTLGVDDIVAQVS